MCEYCGQCPFLGHCALPKTDHFFTEVIGVGGVSISSTMRYILGHPLNRESRLPALMRFARWQVSSRIAPGEIVFRWVGGARIVVRPGDTGFTQNIYCGLHDFMEMGYLLHVLRPDDLFVDIGANVGSYTVLACAVKGARGYCFEPVPETYNRLMDNIVLNAIGSRVVALNIGIAEKHGELLFTSGGDTTNHVAVESDGAAALTKVKVRTLDSVLERAVPAVIKIDVEGFETSVLDGATETLKNASLHSVIMELNGSGVRYGFDEAAIVRRMQALGFEACEYDPFSRRIEILDGKALAAGNNTLFVRDPENIGRIVRESPKVTLGKKSF